MTQEYTPVAWQDETTSQQGTLINAERLNQMQTAHHYADGLEEVDAIPTADPGVDYHKIVYCTADSTIYRWDGTEWTADIDDETKRLLQEEIARATEAEGELAQDIADETTARETADSAMQADISALQDGKLDKKTAGINQTQVYGVKHNTQKMLTLGQASGDIPMYSLDSVLYSKMPTLYDPIDDTVVNYGWATAQIGAEATARADADTALGGRIDTEQARAEAAEQANAQAIANTYTKAEIDTALALKADVATTYTKTETDALLALKADQATTYTKSETDTLLGAKANDNAVVKLTGNQTIAGVKIFSSSIIQSGSASPTIKPGNDPKTTVPATNLSHNMVLIQDDSSNNINGMFSTTGTDGKRTISLYSFDCDGTYRAVRFLNPTAYTPGNTNDVATIGTLDAYTPMVRTTGNQSISGFKTFNKPAVLAIHEGGSNNQDGWRKLLISPSFGNENEYAIAVFDIIDNHGSYGTFTIVGRAGNLQNIVRRVGNYPVTQIKASKDANGEVILWGYAYRSITSLRYEAHTGAISASFADSGTMGRFDEPTTDTYAQVITAVEG